LELPDSLATVCGPPNCAHFATEPLPEGYRFAGLARLRLTVTPSGPAGHLAAYLYEVTSDGAATRLGWGQVDLRFPGGGGAARRVEPGTPMSLDFRLQPLDAVVEPGARLALAVSQGTAYNRLASVPSFPMRLEVGATAGSLTLTRVRSSPGDFFTPRGGAATG
jgi:predicted acyl esterase